MRRGLCQPCRKTFTILPDWLAPSGHYTLQCRQQSCERMSAGDSAEQAVPLCKNPTRLPDPSTLRRWAHRRLLTLWQAGFHNVTCSLGNHLNAHQFRQLCDGSRTVYLAFDADPNSSGQHAAERLSHQLRKHSLDARRVFLPNGHDPNSFFVQGGDMPRFQLLLEAARP